ncbi:MerR family transcriptional regulator [Streptomyces mirabilis]|uniref:hypothetical protein n=1 Tax=Streptomyces mirabilis TaxID=68239 RepID=UPI0036D9DC44
MIQRLYAAGLPSRTIREVLPFADPGEASPGHWTCRPPSATASTDRWQTSGAYATVSTT